MQLMIGWLRSVNTFGGGHDDAEYDVWYHLWICEHRIECLCSFTPCYICEIKLQYKNRWRPVPVSILVTRPVVTIYQCGFFAFRTYLKFRCCASTLWVFCFRITWHQYILLWNRWVRFKSLCNYIAIWRPFARTDLRIILGRFYKPHQGWARIGNYIHLK